MAQTQAAGTRPYIIRMYDRWIILAIILVLAWLARPLFAYVTYYRGVSFERMLQLQTAEHYYRKSITVYKRIPEGWIGLGGLYYMRAPGSDDAYRSSLATYSRGLELNPKSFELAYDLGKTYFLRHQYRSALSAFELAANLRPSDRFALDRAGWSAYLSGNKPLALSYWRRLLVLYPGDPIGRILHQRRIL